MFCYIDYIPNLDIKEDGKERGGGGIYTYIRLSPSLFPSSLVIVAEEPTIQQHIKSFSTSPMDFAFNHLVVVHPLYALSKEKSKTVITAKACVHMPKLCLVQIKNVHILACCVFWPIKEEQMDELAWK